MVGPGERFIGGISSLIVTLLPVLKKHIDLKYLPTVQNRPVAKCGMLSIRNMILALSQYSRFMYVLLGFNPHIIHIHTSQGIGWLKDTFFVLLGKVFKCRVILHMHGGNFIEIHNRSNYLLQRYTCWLLCLADKVIEVSEERRRNLTQITPIERIIAFRNCIDVDVFSPSFSNPSGNGIKALFLGFVGQNKGIFDLLDASARLRSSGCSFNIWIAGDEDHAGDFAKVRSRLHELDLEDECHLMGMVRGESKLQLLRKASLFVLPSYREALPMAILEAMASGLPIVATSVGGIPEVVKDGYNGFLITPGDAEALAEKLNVLASDRHLCKAMGRRSREIAEQELDVKPYVEQLLALYESLAGF